MPWLRFRGRQRSGGGCVMLRLSNPTTPGNLPYCTCTTLMKQVGQYSTARSAGHLQRPPVPSIPSPLRCAGWEFPRGGIGGMAEISCVGCASPCMPRARHCPDSSGAPSANHNPCTTQVIRALPTKPAGWLGSSPLVQYRSTPCCFPHAQSLPRPPPPPPPPPPTESFAN
jgi:hypothetical protein